MKKEDFFEVLGELDDDIVKGAKSTMKEKKNRKPAWVKWGTIAACLCIVIAGVVVSKIPSFSSGHGTGGGVSPGGTNPDGVDPVIASVAVYPATEKIEDVANATVEGITEADAYKFEPLGEYLPTSLPNGYTFGNANLYETTMKDGTRYYMLRVQYTTGNDTAQGNTEEEIAVDPNTLGKSFVVFVMNYEPVTAKQIYAPADITESLLEEKGGSTFHISYGEIFVGISPNTATSDDILVAVASIK